MTQLPKLTVTLKKIALGAVGAAIKGAVAVLPKRVRAMTLDRCQFVQPLDYEKRLILLHVNSEFEYKVRARSVSKERATCTWIESFAAGDVFYDIGANVGAYSLVAAKHFDGAVPVCAFEPSALNFSQLIRNLAVNNCGDTVFPLPIALAEATRPEVFNYRSAVPGAALHSLGAPETEDGQSFVPMLRQQLLAYSLDDVVARYNLPPPTHIKIDVDGAELRILAGGVRTLGSSGVKSVLIEASCQDDTNLRIEEALGACGLRLASLEVVQGGYINYLFERDSSR